MQDQQGKRTCAELTMINSEEMLCCFYSIMLNLEADSKQVLPLDPVHALSSLHPSLQRTTKSPIQIMSSTYTTSYIFHITFLHKHTTLQTQHYY